MKHMVDANTPRNKSNWRVDVLEGYHDCHKEEEVTNGISFDSKQ